MKSRLPSSGKSGLSSLELSSGQSGQSGSLLTSSIYEQAVLTDQSKVVIQQRDDQYRLSSLSSGQSGSSITGSSFEQAGLGYSDQSKVVIQQRTALPELSFGQSGSSIAASTSDQSKAVTQLIIDSFYPQSSPKDLSKSSMADQTSYNQPKIVIQQQVNDLSYKTGETSKSSASESLASLGQAVFNQSRSGVQQSGQPKIVIQHTNDNLSTKYLARDKTLQGDFGKSAATESLASIGQAVYNQSRSGVSQSGTDSQPKIIIQQQMDNNMSSYSSTRDPSTSQTKPGKSLSANSYVSDFPTNVVIQQQLNDGFSQSRGGHGEIISNVVQQQIGDDFFKGSSSTSSFLSGNLQPKVLIQEKSDFSYPQSSSNTFQPKVSFKEQSASSFSTTIDYPKVLIQQTNDYSLPKHSTGLNKSQFIQPGSESLASIGKSIYNQSLATSTQPKVVIQHVNDNSPYKLKNQDTESLSSIGQAIYNQSLGPVSQPKVLIQQVNDIFPYKPVRDSTPQTRSIYEPSKGSFSQGDTESLASLGQAVYNQSRSGVQQSGQPTDLSRDKTLSTRFQGESLASIGQEVYNQSKNIVSAPKVVFQQDSSPGQGVYYPTRSDPQSRNKVSFSGSTFIAEPQSNAIYDLPKYSPKKVSKSLSPADQLFVGTKFPPVLRVDSKEKAKPTVSTSLISDLISLLDLDKPTGLEKATPPIKVSVKSPVSSNYSYPEGSKTNELITDLLSLLESDTKAASSYDDSETSSVSYQEPVHKPQPSRRETSDQLIDKIINDSVKLSKSRASTTSEASSTSFRSGEVTKKSVSQVVLENGDMFEGEVQDDMFNGQGRYYYNNGDKYIGDFVDNTKEGKGVLMFSDNDLYNGDFKDNKFNGKGTYYYKDGSRYQGDWVNNKKEGEGELQFADGDKYVGQFADDKFNGQGKYVAKNGEVTDGKWVDNEYVPKNTASKPHLKESLDRKSTSTMRTVSSTTSSNKPVEFPSRSSRIHKKHPREEEIECICEEQEYQQYPCVDCSMECCECCIPCCDPCCYDPCYEPVYVMPVCEPYYEPCQEICC